MFSSSEKIQGILSRITMPAKQQQSATEEERIESSESRRERIMMRNGSTFSSTRWTLTFLTTCFLVISSVQCLPVGNLADTLSPSSSLSLAASSSSQQQGEPNYYQLIHQGQVYLPTLFQQQQLKQQQDLQKQEEQEEQQQNKNGRESIIPSPQFLRVSQSNEDESIEPESESEWETVIDPHLYILNEWTPSSRSNSRTAIQQRVKRNAGPSLSIVNPLDVLRQRLLLEIARRRMIKSQNQIMANAEYLKTIGRRR